MDKSPKIVVFSSLFPSDVQPMAGLFIRERMFRLGKRMRIVVVSPQPWFPLQGLIRLVKRDYRRTGARFEQQDGIDIYRPRFFSVPGIGRRFDGLSMAIFSSPLLRRLRRTSGLAAIDAHFAYPDGYAATCLGRWLNLPVTITLRGTEISCARIPSRRRRMITALHRATRVFSVSKSLKNHAISLGVAPEKIVVISNGIDRQTFFPVNKAEARRELGVPDDSLILISVGALVERKGFHRIIELLPALRRRYPNLYYVIVGGGSPEGNRRARLEKQVSDLHLESSVLFVGQVPPNSLRGPLSAGDVFVLATSNEGWANVFLEAMACGLPVVTTDVGGNAEVVCNEQVGTIVPFGDQAAMLTALNDALSREWNRDALIEYAAKNDWELRIDQLENEILRITDTQVD